MLGELPFRIFGPSLRILREELLRSLLKGVEWEGIQVFYGSRLVVVEDEGSEYVTAVFENGEKVQADFVLV